MSTVTQGMETAGLFTAKERGLPKPYIAEDVGVDLPFGVHAVLEDMFE